jgi:preprotein translocase subunit YajC
MNMIEILMAPAGGEQGGGAMQLVMILLIGVVFYFFMIRPQSKKIKDQNKFISELKSGDKVVTIAGIHGRISEVAEDHLMIEIAPGVKIKSEKSSISLENSKKVNA